MLMADMSHIAGLIVGGQAKIRLTMAYVITTTTHKTLRGPRGGLILSKGVVGNPLKRPEKPWRTYQRSSIEQFSGTYIRTCTPSAAKAVAFGEALRPEFTEYAQQIVKNAAVLADELKRGGLKLQQVAPVTTWCWRIFMAASVLTGTAQERLEASGITANANAIPNDTLPPFRPSGLRLGTPAVTTRGMKEIEIKQIAELIIAAPDR